VVQNLKLAESSVMLLSNNPMLRNNEINELNEMLSNNLKTKCYRFQCSLSKILQNVFYSRNCGYYFYCRI